MAVIPGTSAKLNIEQYQNQIFTPEHQAASAREICQQIVSYKPMGGKIMLVIVMPATTPGWRMLTGRTPENGIIAILIGLLLPAVQKIASDPSGDRAQLKSLLAPNGSFGINMPTTFVFHNITWL